MRRVLEAIDVARDADAAWQLVGDLSRYDEFVVGTTHWERLSEGRYAIRMQVGAIAAGGEIAVTVDADRRRVHWETVRGTGHTANLQVGETGPDSCRITFELMFDLAGAVAPLTERLATPLVERNLVASLETARHQLEHGPRADRGS